MKKTETLKILSFLGIGCASAIIYLNVESYYVSIPIIIILATLLGFILKR